MWQRLRAVVFALALLSGSFAGVVMRPEDIEELLHADNQVSIEYTIEDQEDDEK